MLIDDDDMTNMIHTAIIKRLDPCVKVTAYCHAQEALTYLKRPMVPFPDYIFLDINMPILDGWGFLDQYQDLPQQSMLYMLTSSIDPQDMIRAKQYDAVMGFVSKPLTVDFFAKRSQSAL
jgi:CheY-like chemotaxis protein